MKILFLSPPNMRFREVSQASFCMGPLYLAAVLRQHHDVAYYDAESTTAREKERFCHTTTSYAYQMYQHQKYIDGLNNPRHPVWQEIRRVICAFGPDIIGISTMTTSFPAALEIARIAKEETKAFVIMGGVHPTLCPDEAAKAPEVDFVVRGEGEVTVPELVACLEKSQVPDKVLGISFMRDGKVVHTADRPLMPCLDIVPPPAYDLLMFPERYPPKSFTNVMGGRGCPFKCDFCANHVLWPRYRMASPDRLFRGIQRIYRLFGKTIFFMDDHFLISDRVYFETCRLMGEQLGDILWRSQARVDAVNKEKLAAAAASGCWDLKLGIESGSDKILALINKKISIEQAFKACEMILDAGIQVSVNFMFGFPEETCQDIRMTMDAIRKIPANSIAVSKLIPLPGTRYFSELTTNAVFGDNGPRYEYMDLYSDHYHCTPHISREQLRDMSAEIFELCDAKNRLTRMGPPKTRAERHNRADIIHHAGLRP